MTKTVNVGGVVIGGGKDIVVQSMCNTKTHDVAATLMQIDALFAAGCQIIRLAVPDMTAAKALGQIVSRSPMPVVADIHFDYRLALEAAEQGVKKIRINPGNIGDISHVKEVAEACKKQCIPIRIGVNGGSLSRGIIEKYGHGAEALCRSAVENAQMLEHAGFYDICVSLKASNVFDTVKAYRLFSKMRDYPLHLGVTEAGSRHMGTLKTAAAFGALLVDGIGDTIRVTLTDDPVAEIAAAKDILKALGLNKEGVNIISCPTCGRTQSDLISIANEVENVLKNVKTKLNIAVMGCAVNGPGEAKEADVGIVCGKDEGLIICKGEILYKAPADRLVSCLVQEVKRITGEDI